MRPGRAEIGWIDFYSRHYSVNDLMVNLKRVAQIWMGRKLPLENRTLKPSFHYVWCRYCGMTKIHETLNSIIFSVLVYLMHKTVLILNEVAYVSWNLHRILGCGWTEAKLWIEIPCFLIMGIGLNTDSDPFKADIWAMYSHDAVCIGVS